MAPSISHSTSYGQVIEYIENRLYLASYTHAPNENTPFPYPTETRKSPQKKSSRAARGPTAVETSRPQPVYFTIDDTLLYNAFHADFGPLHIGHLYRFAVIFHEILGDPANNDRAVVFWSRADSRSRANAACLVACYMVMIQAWPPHLALAPIAQADPPYMPFRDAGYSQADFMLSIQDVVYGVWRAKEQGLCELKSFNLEDYERFERVDQGDFNWVSPDFLAFASPQSHQIAPIPITSSEYSNLPSCVAEIPSADISQPFKNVLTHFVERDIGLVVRLNSELYCPTYFTALGIQHIDMIFEDGTCPALPVVKKFIRLAHNMIQKKKGIAVHCKAGLGRTGCLIGAYLIYRFGFTANEVIAYMRFMRPGMVVGPQQHWLHLNQGQFREWYIEDQLKAKLELARPSTPVKMTAKTPMRHTSTGQVATPPNKSSAVRAALGEIDGNDVQTSHYQDENLPAPTPGQPRKYARMDARNHPYARSASGNIGGSPRRSVSHTITTTTETVSIFEDDAPAPASPVRVTKTRSPSRRSGGEEKSKIRKTSGRVASVRGAREV
ncbi:cell division control protein 14 [Lithohypha guttulata]|nr:cell division control protein 14 [Lithohypha guttulata]